MKAMILAAGTGSRLAPYTDKIPKALVPFQGIPLVEIILNRLKYAGFVDVVINVHHFADQIIEFIQNKRFEGMNIDFSREEILLDTGGGIKLAAPMLGNEPILFHNVDILSELDLREFYEFHLASKAKISLAIKDRETSRNLLFTNQGLLGGWTYPDRNLTILTRNSKKGYIFSAFSGIYIINPELFESLPDDNVFSIMPWIIEVSKTIDVQGFDQNDQKWFDLGSTKNFKKAEESLMISADGAPTINKIKG